VRNCIRVEAVASHLPEPEIGLTDILIEFNGWTNFSCEPFLLKEGLSVHYRENSLRFYLHNPSNLEAAVRV
jgi:hypothetical protein